MYILIILLTIILFFYFYSSYKKKQIYYKGDANEYFNGQTFKRINTVDESRYSLNLFKILGFAKKLFWNNPHKWTEEDIDKLEFTPSIPTPVIKHGIKAYFINHSTVLIQTCGVNIITDPIYAKIAGIGGFLGPKRVHNPGIKFEDLPPIDIVLVSHNHYDHMDRKTLSQLQQRDNPKFITLCGNDYLMKKYNKNFDITALGWGESIEINNIKIVAEKAYHWSRRNFYDMNKALWGSFVLITPQHKIFFAADTAFHDGKIFEELHNKYHGFDLSFLPIGAYEPQEFLSKAHVNPKESVLIHKIIESKKSMAIHFGTFQLSNESYYQPVLDLEIAKKELSIEPESFVALKPGEYLFIK